MSMASLGEGGVSAACTQEDPLGLIRRSGFLGMVQGGGTSQASIPALPQCRDCCSGLPHFPPAAPEDHGETFPKGIKCYQKLLFQPRC